MGLCKPHDGIDRESRVSSVKMLRIYKLAALIVHIIVGVILTLVLVGLFRQAADDRTFRKVMQWWLARIGNILGVKLTVRGKAISGSALFVSNHISWLDIPLLGGICCPRFLSKAEIAKWPIAGWLARQSGTLFIARGHQSAAGNANQDMSSALKQQGSNKQVLFFPEGTTTRGEDVRKYHPRLFASAIETNTMVQAIVVYYPGEGTAVNPLIPYVDEQPLRDNLSKLLSVRCIKAEIHFLEPISPVGKDRKALASLCEEKTREKLLALTKQKSG